jgi:CheY-like chemotaxis protein
MDSFHDEQGHTQRPSDAPETPSAPMPPAEAASDPRTQPSAPKPASKPVLLIVDDQSAVQSLLCMALRKRYQILEASDGVEALARATENLPHLVVADIAMPNMDGVELVEAIRRHPSIAKTPVIIMSGYHRPEARTRLDELGIAAFVNKPFSVSEMCSVIEDVLDTLSTESEPPRSAAEE